MKILGICFSHHYLTCFGVLADFPEQGEASRPPQGKNTTFPRYLPLPLCSSSKELSSRPTSRQAFQDLQPKRGRQRKGSMERPTGTVRRNCVHISASFRACCSSIPYRYYPVQFTQTRAHILRTRRTARKRSSASTPRPHQMMTSVRPTPEHNDRVHPSCFRTITKLYKIPSQQY